MKKLILSIVFITFFQFCNAQVSSIYSISFENAVHHEALVQATFKDIEKGEVEFRMSRSSPGRYALHEFAKNVYNVKVTDGKGKILATTRPDPYSWRTTGHDGTIHVTYTLFANHGDGTYAQVDETHAHLNMPATFMFVPDLSKNEIEVTFNVREDLKWKVATQLKNLNGTTYFAKDLQYFMDSPTEISNHSVRSFTVDQQEIHFILHHNGTEAEFDKYFEKVQNVVLLEKEVYGELPDFDYGAYYFLACYMPNVDGDGMEHRNSTVCTSTSSLGDSGYDLNIGTVAHEFFHSWNVERLRPQSLEPFDFEKANMSGELWFAEGFTSYYAGLISCRAGFTSEEGYLTWLSGSFNYVWNSTGRRFYNPIEMSYQAPFIDAAKSVDEMNSKNTFISYYNYGHMLALALDLSLRELSLNLDDYMKLLWNRFGKEEKAYTNSDLHKTLNTYAGKEFGDAFFKNYIYKSEMPDFERLFKSVGVVMTTSDSKVYFGTKLKNLKLLEYPPFDSPAYNAGLTKGDKLIQIGAVKLTDESDLDEILNSYTSGEKTPIIYERYGEIRNKELTLLDDPYYYLYLFEKRGYEPDIKTIDNRKDWLQGRTNITGYIRN